MSREIDFKAATCVIRCPERGFLIVRRAEHDSRPGEWEFPGGRVEKREEPREAAVREVIEETGLEVDLQSKGHPVSLAVDGRHMVIERFLFETVPESEVELSEEHDSYEWKELARLEDSDELLEWFESLEIIGLK